MYTLTAIFILLFGLAVGSFLNVVIYRVPQHESIVTGPSHCMSCGARLRWYELIPVASFIAQGGKCRHCGVRLSRQYPLIESANALGCFAVWLLLLPTAGTEGPLPELGITWTFMIGCGLLSALIAVSVIDGRTGIIPPGLDWTVAAFGVLRIVTDPAHWASYLIGGAAVSAVLLLIRLISGGAAIGGGDVKLMAAAGLVLGWQDTILAFLLACILGAVIHLMRMKFAGAGRKLAMGPYLSAGIMIAYLFGDRLIAWYTGLLI